MYRPIISIDKLSSSYGLFKYVVTNSRFITKKKFGLQDLYLGTKLYILIFSKIMWLEGLT